MGENDAMTTLAENDRAIVDFMLERLSDSDVVQVYETAEGWGLVGDLAADHMQQRNLDY